MYNNVFKRAVPRYWRSCLANYLRICVCKDMNKRKQKRENKRLLENQNKRKTCVASLAGILWGPFVWIVGINSFYTAALFSPLYSFLFNFFMKNCFLITDIITRLLCNLLRKHHCMISCEDWLLMLFLCLLSG